MFVSGLAATRGPLLVALCAVLSACSSAGDVFSSATGGKRGSTPATVGSGAATSAATAGSGTSGSSGTAGNTGGSLSGSSTSGASGAVGVCDGGVEVTWATGDFCKQSTLDETASVTDLLNPALTTTTDSAGAFSFCVSPGTAIDFEVSAPGYFDTVSQVIVPQVSEQIPTSPVLYLYCNTVYAELEDELQTATPPFVQTQPFVAVAIETTQGLCSIAGWRVALVLPDGGPVTGVGVAYFSGTNLMPGLAGTGSEGGALIYDIPAGVQNAAVTAFQVDAGPDSGCPYVGGAPPFQLSNTFPIIGTTAVTLALYPVP